MKFQNPRHRRKEQGTRQQKNECSGSLKKLLKTRMRYVKSTLQRNINHISLLNHPSRYFIVSTVLLCALQKNLRAQGFANKSNMEVLGKTPDCKENKTMSGQCEMQKSIKQLQTQWAGGIDVWPKVPTNIDSMTLDKKSERDVATISIQTRVLKEDERDTVKTSEWPDVIRNSILFGFGAYNPRGKELPTDVNEKQHARLEADIKDGISQFEPGSVRFWAGASVWEDGSSEKGFVIAFPDNHDKVLKKGYELVIQLATEYNQGAIYRFDFLSAGEGRKGANVGRLLRTTIPVLDSGTDAKVLVIRDDLIDLKMGR